MTDATKNDVKGWIREVLQEGSSTQNFVDHVVGCPDCYKAVIEKANQTMNYHCENCGLPLPDALVGEGKPSCPNCGCEDCEEISLEDRMMKSAVRR